MAEERVTILMEQDGMLTDISVLGVLLASFETRDFDGGNDKALKSIEGVLIEIQEKNMLSSMTIQFGLKERLTDEVTWLPVESIGGNEPIWVRYPETRYFRFRIVDSAVGGVWKLGGVEVIGTELGARM